MKNKILLLIFSLLIALTGFSQGIGNKGRPLIQTYSVENVNIISQIWSCVQDKAGKMYFGTSSEVVYYDGVNWTAVNGIEYNCFRSMDIDPDGRIFIGSIADIGYLGYDSIGTVTYYSLKSLIPSQFTDFSDIWDTEVYNGKVYFFSFQKLFIYDYNTITVREIDLTPFFGFIVFDKFYIIQDYKGIGILDNDSIYILPGQSKISENLGRKYLMPYSENKMLIADQYTGLWLYDISKLPSNPQDFDKITDSDNFIQKFDCETDEMLIKNQIYCTLQFNDSLYAFGTNNGLYIINKDGTLFQVMNKDRGLPSDYILGLFKDYSENLWILTSEGIVYSDILSPITYFTADDGLEGSIGSYEFFDKKMYMTSLEGLYKIDNQELNNCLIPKLVKISQSGSYYWDVKKVNNTLFTIQENLLGYLKNDEIIPFKTTSAKYRIEYNPKFPDYIFYGSDEYLKASKFRINTDKSVEIFNEVVFDDYKVITKQLITDSLGNIWILSPFSGIFCVKFNDKNNIRDYQFLSSDTSSYYKINPMTMISVLDGKLYVYNNNKILIPYIEDTVIKYQIFEGLGDILDSNQYLVSLLKISDGRIFSLNDSGFCYINKEKNNYSLNYKQFSTIKGYFEHIEAINDIIWISTNNGVFRFDPSADINCNSNFNTIISRVYLNSDSLIFNGNFVNINSFCNNLYSNTLQSQNGTKIPEIEYKNNSVIFEYSALFYIEPEKNQFKYLLEGFDNDWSEWTTDSKKEYTNLPPGEYTFRVKAKNIYETESSVSEYNFKILLPWYRTFWAYSFYVLLLILFIFLIVKFYNRRLIKQKNNLELIVKERTHEIREKNEELLQQKEEIQSQNEKLVHANEEITTQKDLLQKSHNQITSSINYAKRIQSAVLLSENKINNIITNYFIFLKPRDVVSGDFYFFRKIQNFIFVAAADCTGHGVPGAFMSMLGIALLNEIVVKREITTTSQVLEELRTQIKISLNQTGDINDQQDGMDIAFCAFDQEALELSFSGANNPCWIFRPIDNRKLIMENDKNQLSTINYQLLILEADSQPIGIYLKEKPFTEQKFQLQKDDILYVFSDGYESQFGGDKNEKFKTKRFKELLSEICCLPMTEQKQILEKRFDDWKGNNEQTDDVLIVGVKI